MPAARALATYRRMIEAFGETVTLRRLNPSPEPATEVTMRARVTSYDPVELVEGVQQGERLVVLMAEDIGSFPVPIEMNGRDRIVIRGAVTTPVAVDDSTRRIGGVLIAYGVRVIG